MAELGRNANPIEDRGIIMQIVATSNCTIRSDGISETPTLPHNFNITLESVQWRARGDV